MNRTAGGWLNGLIAVVIFSGSMPATRAAVLDLDPVFVTVARAAIAGVLAAAMLVWFREKRPSRADMTSLAITSGGVVLGFPLLSALALRHVTAAHSLVFLGLLPLSTAVFAVLRGGERPQLLFWLFSGLGSVCVAGFSLMQGGSSSLIGDGLLLAAVIVCGLGYAEGARLSRTLGGSQVISWALVIALPLMLPASLLLLPSAGQPTAPALVGLAYVSVFSMLIGFIFWYRGLSQGGIAAVGQLQLLQPFFGLALAALLLHETVTVSMLLVVVAVIGCVAGAKTFSQPRKGPARLPQST